jgi:Flp pilus assembly protein TadG
MSRRTATRRRRGERGIAIIIVALLLIPLLLFAGLATDVGAWYARAAAVQRAADAAALAGVAQLADGENQAIAEAIRVASLNGFTDGVDGVTVQADRLAGTQRIFVEITDSDVDRYLTSPFRSNVSISRRATAEQVQPVPLGSPRNYLGVQSAADTDGSIPPTREDNYWVSISGYCAYREHGDRITPRGDAQHSGSFQGCTPGTAGVRSNPEYQGRYFFGVTFTGAAANQAVQVFDAPFCSSGGIGDEGDGGQPSAKQYRFILRSPGPDPETAPIVNDVTYSPADCGSLAGRWVTIGTVTTTEAATYYLEVQPVVPTDQTGADSQEGQNRMAMRVNPGGGAFGAGEPCATSPIEDGYTASCVANVYALTHLGIQATVTTNPIFYLADIGPEHNGKTLTVELFDAAENNDGIELIPPTASPTTAAGVSVEWEVACMDGSYRSDNGGACATSTGEAAPSPGYGPFTGSYIAVSGENDSYRPWGARNSQNGRYSDRIIRLTFELPDDITAAYGGRTWWRIRYDVASSGTNDRTTWTVRVEGDPVRLVPNS